LLWLLSVILKAKSQYYLTTSTLRCKDTNHLTDWLIEQG
jgi:hypothetical protein